MLLALSRYRMNMHSVYKREKGNAVKCAFSCGSSHIYFLRWNNKRLTIWFEMSNTEKYCIWQLCGSTGTACASTRQLQSASERDHQIDFLFRSCSEIISSRTDFCLAFFDFSQTSICLLPASCTDHNLPMIERVFQGQGRKSVAKSCRYSSVLSFVGLHPRFQL
jgi:hypothetical protein